MKAAATHRTRPLARLHTLTVCLLLFGGASTSPANSTAVIGQTASANLIVDGSPVPSGTTLLSPSKLETRTEPGRVFLAHGQILALDMDTRASLETNPRGEIEVAVDGGAVAVQSGTGEQVTAFASQRLVFVQPPVQIAQLGGQRTALALPLVVLAAGGCVVDASGGCSPEGDECAEKDGTCECVKIDEATGICEECDCDGAAAVVPAGLSTGAKVGIGIGAGLGAAVLINELDDDDEPPASPVN